MLYVIVVNPFIISLTDFKSFRETEFHGNIQRLSMELGMNSSDSFGKSDLILIGPGICQAQEKMEKQKQEKNSM